MKKYYTPNKRRNEIGNNKKEYNVCFEVDIMSSMDKWKSVIVSGKFQELAGVEAEKGREYLFGHVSTLMTNSSIHQHQHKLTGTVDDSNRKKPIMY